MGNFKISGHIVDVVRQEIYDGTVEVKDGKISGIRRNEVDEGAPYIMPGFVDSHIHIESTLLTPSHYAALAVAKGVVSIVTDPHEIANVTGLEGIEFMIADGRKVHFHFNFGASPCVPCTGFETAGAVIDAKDIEALLQRDEVYGVAEFMNAFGVMTGDAQCLAKLKAAKDAGKPVDGHAPGLSGDALRKYAEAGVSTDHECVTIAEGRERIACGMLVQIREGSAACDFANLSDLLVESADHLMFCSDDKYPNELMEGYIDALVRESVAKGYPLWNILNAACLTPVRHYNLKHGLLQAGDNADFIVVDDMKGFNVLETYIDGLKVYGDGRLQKDNFVKDFSEEKSFPNRFAAEAISSDDLKVSAKGGRLKVITARDLSLLTGMELVKPAVEDGFVVPDVEKDILKMVVYNRYVKAAPQVAFVKGFRLKAGAMASTIAHDSHNIIAIGTSDDEIAKVINRLVETKGGIAISDGGSISHLALPVAGLMSPLDGEEVAGQYEALKKRAAVLGCPFNAPFMTMAFMALPVIPDLKLTDKGLFDVTKFEFTDLMEA